MSTIYLALALIVSGSIALPGQEPATGADPVLDLESVIHRAREVDHRVRTTTLQERQAQAGLESARYARLPSLRLGAGYTRLNAPDPPEASSALPLGEDVPDRVQVNLDLEVEFFTGFSRSAAEAEAQLLYRAAGYRRQQMIARAEFVAVQHFWEAVAAQERARVKHRAVERARAHRNYLEDQHTEGLATTNHTLLAHMQETDAVSSAALADSDALRARQRLLLTLDLPLDETPILRFDLEDVPRLPPIREPDQRPDIHAAELRVSAAEEHHRAAAAGRYPRLSAFASYLIGRPNQHQFPPEAAFTSSWKTGVQIGIDLGAQPRIGANLQRTAAIVAERKAEQRQLRREADLEARAARMTLEDTDQLIKTAHAMKRQAEENLRVMRSMAADNLVRRDEVLEAEELLLNAELRLLQHRIAREIARARYRFVTGHSGR